MDGLLFSLSLGESGVKTEWVGALALPSPTPASTVTVHGHLCSEKAPRPWKTSCPAQWLSLPYPKGGGPRCALGLGFAQVTVLGQPCTMHSDVYWEPLISDGGRRGDIDGESLKLMDWLLAHQWRSQCLNGRSRG